MAPQAAFSKRHSRSFEAGEVWFADLGMAEKSRPVLVLAVPKPEDARSLVIVAPLTSQIRGMRGVIDLAKPRWLSKPSAVNLQGLASFDRHKPTRRMDSLTKDQMDQVKARLRNIVKLILWRNGNARGD